METYGPDAGNIIIIGVACLMAGMAAWSTLRTPIASLARRLRASHPQNERTPLPDLHGQLQATNASIAELKTISQRQQAKVEAIGIEVQAIRRTVDDHATDLKTGIEKLAGATDAARAEATEHNQATTATLSEIARIAGDTVEFGNNTFLAVNGLRNRIDEIKGHVAGIPDMRGEINRLQQSVAAAAQSTAQPAAAAGGTKGTGNKSPRKTQRQTSRAKKKAAREETRAARDGAKPAATQPAGTPRPETTPRQERPGKEGAGDGKPPEQRPEQNAGGKTESTGAPGAAAKSDTTEAGTAENTK